MGPGLGLGMRFGRRKAEVTRSAKQSTLEQLYELAHSTFKLRKDVFPSEVERVRELLCKHLLLSLQTPLICDSTGVSEPETTSALLVASTRMGFCAAAAIPLHEIGMEDYAASAASEVRFC